MAVYSHIIGCLRRLGFTISRSGMSCERTL
jgi:hypothetical protein